MVLNAAGALYVSPGGRSFAECVATAADGLANGSGAVALDRMRLAYGRR